MNIFMAPSPKEENRYKTDHKILSTVDTECVQVHLHDSYTPQRRATYMQGLCLI